MKKIFLISLVLLFTSCTIETVDYYRYTFEVEYYDHVKDTIDVKTSIERTALIKTDHGTSYLEIEYRIVAYKVLNFKLLKQEKVYKNKESELTHYTNE